MITLIYNFPNHSQHIPLIDKWGYLIKFQNTLNRNRMCNTKIQKENL